MKQEELSGWLKCGLFGLLFCIYVGPETGKMAKRKPLNFQL
ncbi:hypothetical protein ACMGD3_08320 [Lysinibacillus sphaericus]